MLHVIEVQPRGGYRLWLHFDDGADGEVDLGPELEGPIFEPLRDPRLFAGGGGPGGPHDCVAEWRRLRPGVSAAAHAAARGRMTSRYS
jgi:hypothetical protein